MIVLLIMIIVIFYLIGNKFDSKYLKKNLFRFFLLAMFFQAILLIIYRLNLNSLGRTVYYSDAAEYWDATLKIISGQSSYQPNRTYYYTCALIQVLSPIRWVGWNNIFNVLSLDLSVLLIAIEMEKIFKYTNKTSQKNIVLFSAFVLFNPLINYALFRNLKDAEFLLLSSILLTGISDIIYEHHTNRGVILFLVKSFVSLFLIYNIRPWGFAVFAVPLIVLFLYKRKNKKNNSYISLLIPLAILIVIPFRTKIISTLNIWAPIVLGSAKNKGIKYFVIGFFKLLLGPGPIRCINGSKYFMFYTISGNYMSFVGSCIWLLEFGLLISAFIREKRFTKHDCFSLELLIYTLIYSVVYVFQYGGGAELRIKAPLAVIVSAFLLVNVKKIRKVDIVISLILFSVMIAASVVWGV